jgi:hypothetical protein
MGISSSRQPHWRRCRLAAAERSFGLRKNGFAHSAIKIESSLYWILSVGPTGFCAPMAVRGSVLRFNQPGRVPTAKTETARSIPLRLSSSTRREAESPDFQKQATFAILSNGDGGYEHGHHH